MSADLSVFISIKTKFKQLSEATGIYACVELTYYVKKCIISSMKYAVITDLHSNIFALKAALCEIDKVRPDKIICLGDISGNGFYPEETVSLVRSRKDMVCVKGNHDIFVTTDLNNVSSDDPRIKMFRWQQKVLSSSSKKFLSSLPQKINIKDGKFLITAFHYPINPKGRYKDMKYLPTKDDLLKLFGDQTGDIFLFGHEHTGSVDEIDGRYYLNFGTLGNLLNKNEARFGILDINGDKVEYKRMSVYYDDAKARETTEKLNVLLNKRNKFNSENGK